MRVKLLWLLLVTLPCFAQQPTEHTDGTNTAVIDPCEGHAKTFTNINLAATSATKLVALGSSKKTYICEIHIISAAANNVVITSGTKTTNECDTSAVGVFGGTTTGTGWNLAANGGLVIGNGSSAVGAGGTSLDICITASASGQVTGNLVTVQQ